MLDIKFQDNEYILLTDSISQGGAITTIEDYETGKCSFAHLKANGDIVRFGEIIGYRNDIQIMGEAKDFPTINIEQVVKGLLGNTWHK